MERREIVNAPTETGSPATLGNFSPERISPHPVNSTDVFSRLSPQRPELAPDIPMPRTSPQSLKFTPRSSYQGPCLYIGPAGQRCSRPAGGSGFCAKHQVRPDEERSGAAGAKRAVAVVGVLAALWPIIAELVRELIRLLH